MKLTVTLQGLDALSLRVKYLARAAERGLAFGVSEGALLIQEEAKLLVPVDTGNLRDSIHTEVVRDEPAHQELCVVPAVEAANDWGFDPAYARRIEFGFVGPDRLGRVYNQPPQPYMRPALDSKRAEVIDTIKQSVQDEMLAATNAAAARRNR